MSRERCSKLTVSSLPSSYELEYLFIPADTYKISVLTSDSGAPRPLANRTFTIEKLLLPPPGLRRVQFDDSLVRFRAFFDAQTNMAAMVLGSPCR
eukprot:SAG22_NODE_1139_length_5389_cov_1.755577_7_plen_95_part_00